MGESVGSSPSSRKQPGLSVSLYRTSRQFSTSKAPPDPIASEILQARHQQTQNRQKLIATRNRIRFLEFMQQQRVRTTENKRRTAAFISGIRERQRVEMTEREKIKAKHEEKQLDTRIRLLRDKQERSALISTAKHRVLSEKRETVEEIKRISEQMDVAIESHREMERQRNVDRRRKIVAETCKRRQERTLSAENQREMLKTQYRNRLEFEQRRVEEEALRLSALRRELEGCASPVQQQTADL